jgi:hypothetical protein
MVEIDIITNATAFLMQRSKEISFEQSKQAALEEIKKHSDFNPDYITFAELGMPCGEKLIFKTEQDFLNLEEKDIPCPCGDSTHWLFRSVILPCQT